MYNPVEYFDEMNILKDDKLLPEENRQGVYKCTCRLFCSTVPQSYFRHFPLRKDEC